MFVLSRVCSDPPITGPVRLCVSMAGRWLCVLPRLQFDVNVNDRREPMLGIIESNARYRKAMEAAARQRQQTYDNGLMGEKGSNL